ncbi:Prophage PssSM-01, Orf2, partial [Pseudomonas savastanoi pv. glycinea]
MSMKLHKVLTIGGVTMPLINDDVRLDLKSPGRATFTIKAGVTVKGLVTFDIGYNEAVLQRHFIGYVERCTATNGIEQVVLCRELAAVLANPLPMNLRHVDLRA